MSGVSYAGVSYVGPPVTGPPQAGAPPARAGASGDVGTTAPRGSWATWCVLAAVAVSLALVALQAYRILTGAGFLFFPPDEQGTVSRYHRVAAFVQLIAPDRRLVLPLLGLFAAAWLTGGAPGRARTDEPARWVAAGLCVLLALEALCLVGMLGYLVVAAPPADDMATMFGPDRLDELSGPVPGAVLLLCLSVLLARLLIRPSVEPPAGGTSSGAAPGLPEREASAGDPLQEVADEATSGDPHAAYRRPGGTPRQG